MAKPTPITGTGTVPRIDRLPNATDANSVLDLPTHIGWLLSSLGREGALERTLDAALADLANQVEEAATVYVRGSHEGHLRPAAPDNTSHARPGERPGCRLAAGERMAA